MDALTPGYEVFIDLDDVQLPGHICLPDHAAGLVVFAHGSGSSRFSPRNNQVAEYLQRCGLGTLLFDLLTPTEDEVDQVTRHHRFDIPLLSRRLTGAVDWLSTQAELSELNVGLFGSSTGAAAALIAAAEQPQQITAVVSRGGRPDLAGDFLTEVIVPTLLIVGGKDEVVIELNRQAKSRLSCLNELAVIAGATHLFAEPGALDQVMRLSADWFINYLSLARQDTGVGLA